MIITILAPRALNRKGIFDVPFSEKKVKETNPTLEKDVSLSKWYWEKGNPFSNFGFRSVDTNCISIITFVWLGDIITLLVYILPLLGFINYKEISWKTNDIPEKKANL